MIGLRFVREGTNVRDRQSWHRPKGGEKVFPNLNAEQARWNKSNADMAALLGLSRVAYETKKREGRFVISEINALCEYFGCGYSYLFAEIHLIPTDWRKPQ